jgi:uncharacterized protein
MPIHKVSGGWQWGEHGHVYPSRAGAERQAAAAHAHGYQGDATTEVFSRKVAQLVGRGMTQKQAVRVAYEEERSGGIHKDAAWDEAAVTAVYNRHAAANSLDTVRAAGVALEAPSGKVLFVKRSDKATDQPGKWAFPGGHLEEGETERQAAAREVHEETGRYVDPETLYDHLATTSEGFSTFRSLVNEEFTPALNHEHSAFKWATPYEPPQPLHPGVTETLFFALPGTGGDGVSPEYEPHATGDAVTKDQGYFAPIEAGKTRRLTPEGFLLCEDVAIARTGEQVYSKNDLPGLMPGDDGKIVVYRSPDEVFHPDTIASFEGKPVTIFHPTEFVNPENWKQHSVGHVQNVHRGEGAEATLLKGDILITDAAAVHYAMQNLPDISCGYDAKYQQHGPGRASQHEIRGNHAALVPNGRAGERCAIKDHQSATSTQELTLMSKSTVAAAIGAFFKGKGLPDAASAELQTLVAAADAQPQATHDAEPKGYDKEELKKVVDAAVRDAIKIFKDAELEETKKAKEATDKKARDEAEEEKKRKEKENETDDTIIEAEEVGHVISLGKVWNAESKDALMTEIRAKAEIMAPGTSTSMPTADARKGNKGAALTAFLRNALRAAQTKDAEVVKPFLMGRTVDSLRGVALCGAFNGVAELMKLRNNAAQRAIAAGLRTVDGGGKSTGQITAADYAAKLAEGRKKQAAA